MTKQDKYEMISTIAATKMGLNFDVLEFLGSAEEENFIIATDRYTYIGVSDDKESLDNRVDTAANIITQMSETVKSGTEVDESILPPYIAAVYNNIKLFFRSNGRLPDFEKLWEDEVDGIFIRAWIDESMFTLRKDKE